MTEYDVLIVGGAVAGPVAAKAISQAEKTGKPVIDINQRLMRNLAGQTRKNQQRGIMSFKSNQELQKYLDLGMMKMGVNMMIQTQLNKIRPAEKQVMIP